MKDLTLGKIGGWLIGLIALGATSSRTIHFLNSILPSSEAYLSWLAVAILDFGLLFWLSIYLTGSKGQSQRSIALGMIILSGVGIALTTAGDMFLMFEGSTAKSSTWGLLALSAVLLMLIANIAAKVSMAIADPNAQRRAAESELTDSIEDEAITQMRTAIPAVAKELAAAKVSAQLTAIRNATLASLPAGTFTPTLPTIEEGQPVRLDQQPTRYPYDPSSPAYQPEGRPIDPALLQQLVRNYMNSTRPEPAPTATTAPKPPTYAADSGSDPEAESSSPKNL